MATVITKTIKPSGGDYTSLSNWEAGEQANLVALNEIAVAECYSMTDTTKVNINGWTTGANNYIEIYTPLSERHKGVWDDSKYILSIASAYSYGLILNVSNIYIEGLQISITGDFSYEGGIGCEDSTGFYKISKNIIRGVLSSGVESCFAISTTSGAYIWNNIIYGWKEVTGNINGVFLTNGPGYAYNNTIVNCFDGAYNPYGGGITLVNNIFSSCTNDVDDTSYASVTATYCSTTNDNTKGLTPSGTGNRFSQSFAFVNPGSNNYQLAQNDTGAKGWG
jgi:hypothetical protein